MHVSFITESSKNIGMGHIARCKAVARFFENASFGLTDQTDLTIIDTYNISTDEIKAFAQKYFTVVFDDFDKIYPVHLVIDTTVGSATPILREEFETSVPIAINKEVKNVLVTMGGSDPNGFTQVVIDSLQGYNLHIVQGPLMQDIKPVKNITVYKEPKMAELMQQCDVAIASAGGTVKELMAMGVPSLFVLQAENQRSTFDFLERIGLGELCLGSWQDVTNIDLSILQSYEKRKQIQQTMLNNMDKHGTKKLAHMIKDEYEKWKTNQ